MFPDVRWLQPGRKQVDWDQSSNRWSADNEFLDTYLLSSTLLPALSPICHCPHRSPRRSHERPEPWNARKTVISLMRGGGLGEGAASPWTSRAWLGPREEGLGGVPSPSLLRPGLPALSPADGRQVGLLLTASVLGNAWASQGKRTDNRVQARCMLRDQRDRVFPVWTCKLDKVHPGDPGTTAQCPVTGKWLGQGLSEAAYVRRLHPEGLAHRPNSAPRRGWAQSWGPKPWTEALRGRRAEACDRMESRLAQAEPPRFQSQPIESAVKYST